MNLYLIKRPDGMADYGEVDSVVVVASTTLQARRFFAGVTERLDQGPGNEGASAWLDPSHSTVTLLGQAHSKFTAPMVVCRSFNAG